MAKAGCLSPITSLGELASAIGAGLSILVGLSAVSALAVPPLKLMWDPPTNGPPNDSYAVYQAVPTNAKPVKLGDTTNNFWLLESYPTNRPVKWLVTARRNQLESLPSIVIYDPSLPFSGPTAPSDQSSQPAPLAPAAVRTNLVVNGGFEDRATGWTLTGNCGFSASPGLIAPAEGQRCLVFNFGQTSESGALSQSIPTVPGMRYALTFDAGIIALVNKKAPQRLSVVVRGSATLLDEQVAVASSAPNKATFLPQSFAFAADTNTVTVTFSDVSTRVDKIYLLLDDVKVLPAP